MKMYIVAAAALAFGTQPALAKSEPDNAANTLTHGMAQMTLHVGTTTQEEVLETFGAPNITTLDAQGQEVWVYDRQATVTSSGSSGFSIGMVLGGAGSGVGARRFRNGNAPDKVISRDHDFTVISMSPLSGRQPGRGHGANG